MKQTDNRKKLNIFLCTIAAFLLILWTIRIDLINMDDTFTLRMLQHPFGEIIKLDSMDVHPPLYYLILKIFFSITFISHASPFIQIIAGRLFNVLLFAVTLVVMQKVLSKLTRQHISFAFLLLVCLFPTVIRQATGIRMYGLSALLIACELNSIINFNRNQRAKDIILATIFAALGAWTHYFTAIIAGLLLFYNFVAEKHKRIPYCISGIVFFILFIPWLKISMNQVSSVKNGYWIKNNIGEYFSAFLYQRLGKILGNKLALCFAALFILCLVYIAYKMLENFDSEFKKYYVMVSSILFGTILLGFILSEAIRPIFQGRYVYGISLIYFIMTLPLIDKFITINANKMSKLVKCGIFLLIGAGTVLNLLLGVFYNLKGIKVYQNVYQVEHSDVKVINSDKDEAAVTLMNSFLVQDKTYTTKHYAELSKTCQSKNLFKEIYPNIKDN